MRKLVTSSVVVLLAALSIGVASAQPYAKITRADHCNRQQQKFADEITEHAEAKRAAEAKVPQKKTIEFWADNQQAQCTSSRLDRQTQTRSLYKES